MCVHCLRLERGLTHLHATDLAPRVALLQWQQHCMQAACTSHPTPKESVTNTEAAAVKGLLLSILQSSLGGGYLHCLPSFFSALSATQRRTADQNAPHRRITRRLSYSLRVTMAFFQSFSLYT